MDSIVSARPRPSTSLRMRAEGALSDQCAPHGERRRTTRRGNQCVLIEGYAALFGVEDLSGDVVRAGAFARSIGAGAVPMLLQHRSGAIAGRWARLVEDGRGLFVRGLIESDGALAMLEAGLDGLSIGFRARLWKPRVRGGRDLIDVDLVEVSLVAEPMQPLARFSMVGDVAQAA